jgi:AcrR family transcriptional regulator
VWLHELAKAAADESDTRMRVRALLAGHFALHERQRGGAARLAIVSDVHSLEPDVRAPLTARFREIVHIVRGFFSFGDSEAGRLQAAMSAVALLSVVFWISAWIDRYLVSDFERIRERMLALLEHGLAAKTWASDITLLEDLEPQDPQTRFLHAATNQINLHGYRGASVANIAAELGVSIGSFYHHLDNKDDLVLACFRRSFDLFETAQARAGELGGSCGDRVGRMADMLIALQFRGASPLLRISAYQALPPDVRARMLAHTGRVTRHISGLAADGMADGSVRATDPSVAGQMVMAMLDGAAELRAWAAKRPLDKAVNAYSQNIRSGIL